MDSKEIVQNEAGSCEEILKLEAIETIEVEDEVVTKSDTSEFSVKSKKDDFTLIVENLKLFVNRSVLLLASPIFEELLNTNTSEESLDELELPGKKYDDVCEFIRCIHPGKMKKVSGENVDQVFPLACEYKVEHLMEACTEVFMSNLTFRGTAVIFDVLDKANKYGLDSLKEWCIELLCNKQTEELDRIEIQDGNEVSVELKNEIQAQIIKKLRIELKQTRQRLQASIVFGNIVGRFSLDGTQLLVCQEFDNAVGWCKEFELRLLGSYFSRKSFNAQFRSCDLKVSFDTAKKSKELTVQLEKVSSAFTITGTTFIITFVVKNWMKGKQDHVVNWITCIKSLSEKQTKSLGALDLLEREANGFIYKDEIQCKIYILQTILRNYQYESKYRLP